MTSLPAPDAFCGICSFAHACVCVQVKDFVAVSKVQRRMIKTEKALAALSAKPMQILPRPPCERLCTGWTHSAYDSVAAGDTGDASDGGTPLAAVLKLCGGAMAEVLFSTALVFWYLSPLGHFSAWLAHP